MVQASGYYGYYIFSLPDGNTVDQGAQYSACVDWISDHEVLITEHLYNTPTISYYLFDARTKTKKVLSSFQ